MIAGGKGNGGHIFALSNDNGVTWTNNQMNEDRLFDYDWSGNPLTFPYDKVSKFTHEFFEETPTIYNSGAFGWSSAINAKGTRCVIGAPLVDYDSKNDSGIIIIFHNDDGYGWVLKGTFAGDYQLVDVIKSMKI